MSSLTDSRVRHGAKACVEAVRAAVMDIKEKALLMTPCEVCEMLGQKRGCRPEDDCYTCGIYAEIMFAQWDATCKLIRERTGKKK